MTIQICGSQTIVCIRIPWKSCQNRWLGLIPRVSDSAGEAQEFAFLVSFQVVLMLLVQTQLWKLLCRSTPHIFHSLIRGVVLLCPPGSLLRPLYLHYTSPSHFLPVSLISTLFTQTKHVLILPSRVSSFEILFVYQTKHTYQVIIHFLMFY